MTLIRETEPMENGEYWLLTKINHRDYGECYLLERADQTEILEEIEIFYTLNEANEFMDKLEPAAQAE